MRNAYIPKNVIAAKKAVITIAFTLSLEFVFTVSASITLPTFLYTPLIFQIMLSSMWIYKNSQLFYI